MAPLYPSFTPTYHHDQYPAIDPTQPSLSCKTKTVLVTGAARGIGKAIALAFAQANAKGIALLGRTASTLEQTASEIHAISPSTTTIVVTADITSQTQVQTVFDTVIQKLGTVPDILVNNAGGLPGPNGIGNLIDVDIEEFWKSFELNTKAPLLVAQIFLRANRTHSPDTARTLINIPSGAAHLPYAPGAAAYATAKLASTKIVEYLHYENPEWNIFNMQPGVVATDLAKQAGRKAPDSPALPAGMAIWLSVSPEAKVLNGRFVWANWDVEELLKRKDEIKGKDLLTICLRGWGERVEEVVIADELIQKAKSVNRDAERE